MHQNSRYNGSPAFSPIGRNLQRLDVGNTSMTNLLTPTRSNKSMMSSTRILTPQRSSTTPRYALSRPISGREGVPNTRSPLNSTQFNSNSTFYTPSKVTKSVLPEESISRVGTPTHQAKYGRAGLFPVVHFFQKKVPVITPKQNSCVIKLSSNSPGLFDDSLDNAFEAQNHINTSQAAEPSTRSVLDALKEISRKRIHGSEAFEKDKEKVTEYSKRTREEDTSMSPKSNATSPQQAPKRICVVDPIYASNTSSFCLKNNKRKLYECWLPSNENKNKKVMSVETQTIEEAKTKTIAIPNETLEETPTKTDQKPTSRSDTPPKETVSKLNNHQSCEADEYENETAASAQRAWDEKIYAIQKKNKLAIVLSRITGEEPKLIPVPRLWDKTNDVTDAALFSGHKVESTDSSKIASSSAGSIINVPSISSQTTSSESISSTPGMKYGFALPSVSKSSMEAPLTTTTSIAAPISSTSSAISIKSTSETIDVLNTSSSATINSASSLPSVNFVSVSKPSIKASDPSKPTFEFGTNLPTLPTSITGLNAALGNSDSVKPVPGATGSTGGFTFGSKLGDVSLTVETPKLSTTLIPPSSAAEPVKEIAKPTVASIIPFSKLTIPTTSVTSSGFATPTLKTSISSNEKSIFGTPASSTATGFTPASSAFVSTPATTSVVSAATSASTFSSPATIFGGSDSSAASGMNGGGVSFATAFGLKPETNSSETTPKATGATPGISFDTGTTKASTSTPGGFAFKLNESSKAKVEVFGGTISKPTSLATPSTGSIFGAAANASKTNIATSVFSTTKSTVVIPNLFNNASQAPTIQPSTTTFGSTNKGFTGGFGSTTTTTTPPAFGTSITNSFGSASGSTSGFGATTTSASVAAPVATFGSGFGTPAPSIGASTTQSSGLPTFGALTSQKKGFDTGASTTATPASGGFAFAAANNAPSFGASTTSAPNGRFGVTPASNANGNAGFSFGSSAPASGSGFGAGSTTTSGFGTASGATASAFGAKTTEAPVFAFGNSTKSSTTTPSSGFGFNASSSGTNNNSGSTFGQAPSGTSAPTGGSTGIFSFGSTNAPPASTNAPFAFGGGSNNTTTTAPSFGSTSGFGSTNAFGSPAPSSDFGSAPNVNPFGKSSTLAPFGTPASNPAQPPLFGSNMSSTPGFGASSSSVNPPSFAAAFGQSPPAQSSFNNTFGGAAPPPAANSTFTFGATSNTSSGFGSASGSQPPAFGNNTTMPNSAFNFKAPPTCAGDASKSAVFAFGSAEPPKPAAGGFNFSAGSSASAGFGGASFGAPAAPQQPGMFNIGASTAAPPKRTPLRAKRRT